MSAAQTAPAAPDAPATDRPKTRQFRKRFSTPRISPESAERQSRVTLLAWNRLGADRAIAFLNTHQDAVDGRPLDVAVKSAAGCEAVEREIERVHLDLRGRGD